MPPPPPRQVRLALAAAAAVFAVGLGAGAPRGKPSVPLGPNSLGPCPGDAIEPDLVVQGQFPLELMGSYVMLPFDVPAGTTSVRVKYCFEGDGHVVDLGLWQARDGKKPWGVEQFRGWGGSSHPDVTITPQGFSTEAEYVAAPKGHVPGRTTRGFLPGPIPAGTWAAELGVAAVVPADEGDEDGLADWRVEIELPEDPAFDDEPYVPAPYDPTPATPAPGWYAGDMHVHAEHSALGDATMTETFDFAFRSLEDGGAGLDFITLSDYVTPSAWGEIGRYQALHPGKLIIRSSEVITYRGHTNNHASLRYVDHRIGPVYELLLPERRAPAPAPRPGSAHDLQAGARGRRLDAAQPRDHLPVRSEGARSFCLRTCRGCPWDYTREGDEALAGRRHRDRIGRRPSSSGRRTSSRSRRSPSGRSSSRAASTSRRSARATPTTRAPETPLQSPIGKATTVVYAQELSEHGHRATASAPATPT